MVSVRWCVVSVVRVVSMGCHQRACLPTRTLPIAACQTSTYECGGVVSVRWCEVV